MNPTLETGVLPDWSPYGVVAGSAVLAAALLLAAGAFSVALLLVFTVLTPRRRQPRPLASSREGWLRGRL